MKKNYQTPEISVIMFECEDIITASIASLKDIGDNIFEFDLLSGGSLLGE